MIKCGGDATNRQIESSTVWLFGSVNISTSNQNSVADMVSHYGKITLGVYDQHNFWVCWIWNCIFLLYSIRNHSIISLQNEKLFGHDWKSNRDFDLKPFVTYKLSPHWYWPSKLSVCAGSEMKDAKIGSILIWYLW